MSEKKLMPKCPYCGWEMQHQFDYPMSYCDVRFYCKHCNAMSPSARGCQTSTESVEKALEEAYKAAMKRYEEPNRVLTLEELKHYNGFIWCESRDGEVFEPGWVEDMYAYGRECETINLCNENIDWSKGRCWLRKPTEQEMENTPWEDEGR